MFSGFIASWLGHRTTIFLAVLVVSSATVLIAVSPSLLWMRAEMVIVGLGAGLYSPSGIATASSLVDSRDEGKVLSIHELGPTFGFIAAPLVVAVLLPRVHWRSCLLIFSVLGLLIGVLYVIFSSGGGFKGEAPVLRNLALILVLPSFWMTAILLALAVGTSMGLFSIIPTFLVFERGLDQELVNTLVGVSRISGLFVLLFAGFLVDRFGAKILTSAILLSAGIVTALMWARSRPILIAAVFLQPLLIASFFPAILTAIARIAPRNFQNLTMSFILPIAYGFGAGVLPFLLGWLGDNASFALGFLIYGAILVACSVLPIFLKLEHDG
jgi:NNP family nitrate/nitrite transporter-like MFS transporter